jgi:hypothetical protein
MVANAVALTFWIWFMVAAFPATAGAPAKLWLLAGTAVLVIWTVATGMAARRLDAGFSTAVGRGVHRGSVLTFTVVNLAVLAAYWVRS